MPRESAEYPTATPDRFGTQERSGPERRLLLAVLSDAIVLLTRGESSGYRVDPRDIAATARWVRSDDRDWPCSFVSICESLGLAHQPIRRALLDPTPPRHQQPTRRRLLAGKPAS
jgi:hypothetical protein